MKLTKLINFCFPWNHKKTYGYLMISGRIEKKSINLILGAKFGDDPKKNTFACDSYDITSRSRWRLLTTYVSNDLHFTNLSEASLILCFMWNKRYVERVWQHNADKELEEYCSTISRI